MKFLAIILLIACAIYLKRLGAENAKQKKSDTYQETYEETRKRLQQLNSRSIQGTKPVVQLESKPELKPEPKPELKPEPKPEPKPAAQWKGQGSHPCWTDGKGRYYLYENDGLCCKVSETKPVETPESKAPVPREGQECHEKTDELMTEYKGEVVRQGYCGNRHEHEGGKNLQWELYDNNVLRIWGSGNMFAVPEREEDYGSFGECVDYCSSPWEAGVFRDSPIEEVWIEDGVTSIGDYAFGRNGSVSDGYAVSGNHFPNLRAVHIPASVTKIGYKAFADCDKLACVTFSVGLRRIESMAFGHCQSLARVTLPDGTQEIGGSAFRECENLTKITIPASVTVIGKNAFADCAKLVIYAPKGSYAEEFAKEHQITFVAD